VVVTDSRSRRDGRYIEQIGYFNPIAKGSEVRLQFKEARLEYWLQQGAQTSDRVQSLIKEQRRNATQQAAA